MANLDHPNFRQPNNTSVWLWRYMDLSKFAAILQRRALIFARSDELGDPFEGSVPQSNARVEEYARFIRQTDPKSDPHANMTDEQITAMYGQFSTMRRRVTKAVFINCWHMNDAESAGMWKLYSRSKQGSSA